ncbi:MAG: FAD:protein FMN transferase [Tractidigestivibacter sp.]|jgi:thiamine biosynthesis lipoprotein|uniref:FAD:protein FMN transferase n=1 Tax=Tractidigestivibacter sp. TaxID=2847320 RepID=UPI003D94B84A
MSMEVVRKCFPSLGTVNKVELAGEPGAGVAELAEMVRMRVVGLHNMWSAFEEGSEVSLIGRRAGIAPARVSDETISILALSRECWTLTGGSFDVTAGPLCRVWRVAMRSGKEPSEKSVARARGLCGMQRLELDPGSSTAFLERGGMGLDLGGIAKGWALDCARELVSEGGARSGLMNFGGTVATVGREARVGIQNPFRPTGSYLASFAVRDECVVTSGVNERFALVGGRRCHHIIDPRTGRPAQSGVVQVTVVGQSAAIADAIATAALVLGEERALPVLQARGLEAVFVSSDGAVRATPGIAGRLSMCGGTVRAEEGMVA